jgi:molecular chaperone HscB
VAGHFCSECGRIQPLESGTDYFAFFGLDRRLQLDEAELEKRFYSSSRQLHPDYFMNATEEDRQASVEGSSQLNDAYRTLRDPISRTQYLLTLEGYKEAEKKAPPELLEEVFDLNMQIEELRMAKKTHDDSEAAEVSESLNEALAGLQRKVAGLDSRLTRLFDQWDATLDSGTSQERKALLDQMSELLSHRSYLRNLVRDVMEEL